MTNTRLLAAFGIAAFARTAIVIAQAPAPRTFEVTSVKTNKSRDQPRRDMAWSGGRRVTLEMIANELGGMSPMDRPVYGDRSGLNGTFDFTLVWNPQIEDLAPNPTDALGLTFVQALREQLGLRLDAQTAPVDVIVVDHVEHPTED